MDIVVEENAAKAEIGHPPTPRIQRSNGPLPPEKLAAIEQSTVREETPQAVTGTVASSSHLTEPSQQVFETTTTQTNVFLPPRALEYNPVPILTCSEVDEDEEMPAINLDSDSDAG